MHADSDPGAPMGRVRLEACPRCAYSLTGLPDAGRCPECGLDYDAGAPMGRFRLEACPRCAYSFNGLPEAGRCPECGFDYDNRTFVLQGISRGMPTLGLGHGGGWPMFRWLRILLWIFVGGCAGFGPQIFVFGAFGESSGWIFNAVLFAIWLTVLIYLLSTGKRERKGVELFMFAAGGFGPCSGLSSAELQDAVVNDWHDVDAVRIDRLGSQWHRLRIGRAVGRRRLSAVRLDAGVSMDAAQAAWVRAAIEDHLARAHDDAPIKPSNG